MATRRRRGPGVYTAEAVLMTLIVGLIFVGGFVGWIIGKYATNSVAVKTVTVNASAGSTNAQSATDIAQAPNFTANDLVKLPTDNWPTAGGNIMNERYSPLDQIDTSNVSKLK